MSATIALLYGCGSTEVANSADVNQNKIHQWYSVDIDADFGSAKAESQFRFGGSLGTTLDLSDPSGVTCNGNNMNGEAAFLRGHVYSIKVDASTTDFTFEYVNNDEESFTNSVHLEPISLDLVPASINAQEGGEITWAGAAVSDNETVTLHLTNDQSSTSFSTSTMGATSVAITPEFMKDFKGGVTSVYLVRYVNKACDESADEGGTISATYTSSKQSVEVVNNAVIQ